MTRNEDIPLPSEEDIEEERIMREILEERWEGTEWRRSTGTHADPKSILEPPTIQEVRRTFQAMKKGSASATYPMAVFRAFVLEQWTDAPRDPTTEERKREHTRRLEQQRLDDRANLARAIDRWVDTPCST
jgi:hypothetical protein